MNELAQPSFRLPLPRLNAEPVAIGKGFDGVCRNILAHREALWRFVTERGVEPTNNHAERELRGFVLWRKATFGSRSDRGLALLRQGSG